MENLAPQSIEEVDDISARDEYKVALDAGLSPEEALAVISKYSRDNARTPVQWDDSPNAGFSAADPWLRINPNYTRINAADQEKDDTSVLSFYKKLIALRKNPDYQETIVYGALIPYLEEQHNLMAYYRKGDKTLLVAGNFQKEPQEMKLPAPVKKVLLNNYSALNQTGESLLLDSYQAVILELA